MEIKAKVLPSGDLLSAEAIDSVLGEFGLPGGPELDDDEPDDDEPLPAATVANAQLRTMAAALAAARSRRATGCTRRARCPSSSWR